MKTKTKKKKTEKVFKCTKCRANRHASCGSINCQCACYFKGESYGK